ncbi:MAG: cupin domain-containing protein [Gammaproteobacteria bacterium]|nr:cupin domain-containing protein [Gammaproteobacteria bacterium]
MTDPVKFDPSAYAIGIGHDFRAALVADRPDPQTAVDGATFGIATMSENSPHNGERHPDGDEVLYLIAGKVRVVFVDGEHDDIDVSPGDGLIVPKGIWHRVDILEPSQIVYLTPGPNNEYRPLE